MRMGVNVYKIVVGKPEEKISYGRRRLRLEYDIKMDLKGMGCEGVDCI
jgi:hypothetical protein